MADLFDTGRPVADTPIKRGRGGVIIDNPMPYGGTPRTVGMAPFRAGLPSMQPPAATINAVNVANDMRDQPAYPTQERVGYDRGVAESKVFKPTPPGQVSKLSPDANVPYSGEAAPSAATPTTNPYDITRQIALRDSSINMGLPRMSYRPSVGGGGGGNEIGGRGMFPPELMGAIQDYHDLAMKADDGSIAGAWRARGFARRRDNLLNQATMGAQADAAMVTALAHGTTADAAMMRAQNEPMLDQWRNMVAMRGQDVTARGQDLTTALGLQQDLTHRYGIGTTAETARYTADQQAAAQMAHTRAQYELGLPEAQIKQLAGGRFAEGDLAAGATMLGHQPPLPKPWEKFGEPMTGGVVFSPAGPQQGSYAFDPKTKTWRDITLEDAKAAKEKLTKEQYGK